MDVMLDPEPVSLASVSSVNSRFKVVIFRGHILPGCQSWIYNEFIYFSFNHKLIAKYIKCLWYFKVHGYIDLSTNVIGTAGMA